MPRHPIHGRVCKSRVCRRPLDPTRPKGTQYCDSSCRAEETRARQAEGNGGPSPKRTGKALRSARGKPRRERKPTAYCVLRKDLDAGLIGGFVVIGFCAETNKRRAIAKIAAARDDHGLNPEFVAVSVATLKLHDSHGEPVAERNPRA